MKPQALADLAEQLGAGPGEAHWRAAAHAAYYAVYHLMIRRLELSTAPRGMLGTHRIVRDELPRQPVAVDLQLRAAKRLWDSLYSSRIAADYLIDEAFAQSRAPERGDGKGGVRGTVDQLISPQDAMTFDRDGARRFAAALDRDSLRAIEAALSALPPDRAGIRLKGLAALDPHLAVSGAIGAVAASALGARARPVRAILFDKTPGANWKVGWHQDRSIAVRQRVEVPGYGPWSRKAGLPHVAPPFELLADMVTLRAHLDAVDADNAPLLIARGSHRLGRVAEADIDAAVERCGSFVCLAEAGDIWLYATPILHASEPAAWPRRRRVLQVDSCARDLPGGLEWAGA